MCTRMRGDAELLEAWRQGDRAAGSELFERHYAAVVRFFANKVSGDPADLIQETFEACVKGRDRLNDDAGFVRYLFGVAYNVLRRHYERNRKHDQRFDPGTESTADLSPGPATMMARRDEHRLLLAALRRIPLAHQVVLELFYWEGMTSATIAEVLDTPHGTIRTRLRRARQEVEAELAVLIRDPVRLQQALADIDTLASEIREDQESRDDRPSGSD
ncbi:MAG: sigma-70 family RNA polymerase sigma factor [Myxococcales bacterium]|nr:sigma-70 family RNA polymerase sigma factor [Myxococcales bacterium]